MTTSKDHPEKQNEIDIVCRTDNQACTDLKAKVPTIIEKIIDQCTEKECYSHINFEPITSEAYVVDIIQKFREVLFPGYYGKERIDPANLRYNMGKAVLVLYEILSEQITRNIRHECLRYGKVCSDCTERGHALAIEAIETIPDLRKILATDVQAAFDGDPAAKSHDEIIFCYPGIFAITVYRVAHMLSLLKIPLLPRIMSEHAHAITGIDLHPGATIGKRFVIDHGTGIVIGETTIIGDNVRIYQNVTVGALSLSKKDVERLRSKKRHPTIENDVIIYSGATILGGDTTIGERSVIGGNVWVTQSVPPDTTVLTETPKLIFKTNSK